VNLDHAEVFAALAIPGVAGLWRSASLQHEISKEWSDRVDDTKIALEDRATTELLEMQEEITRIFGAGSGSPPKLATHDPGLLSEKAGAFQKTLAMSSRLKRDYQLLLRIGPLLILASAAFLAGLAATFMDNSELVTSQLLRVGGEIIGGVGIVLGILLLFAWVVLNQRLSKAELRSQEGPGK
jgi:hypothetical protein